MRSMLGPASEVFTEEGRDMDRRIIEHFQCWIIYVLGVLILHQINGRFATNFNGSRNSSYHLEVYWLSAESSKFYTEIKQRII